jgi:hypothetical protein
MTHGMAAPPPPSPAASRDLAALRRAIAARAREFEIGALLDLLATLGYRPDDICFRGQPSEAPQPTLVHHIDFSDLDEPAAPGRAASAAAPVTVTVSLGLLSCRSPLPSYFQHLLRDSVRYEPLVELLQLLDRNLLRNRLTAARPERLVPHWRDLAGDLLRVHGLDSLVGLSWLFRHVFPELPSAVERTADELRVPYASARLGFSALGSACVGAATPVDIHDFQVTLRCPESLRRPGVPWLHEIEHRLHGVVFPALEPVAMNLTIVLVLADDHAVAMLRDDRPPPRESYLGVDPLGTSAAAPSPPPRRVVLHRGLLPQHAPDTDALERLLAAQLPASVTPRAGDARHAGDCELELSIATAGGVHRYHATVRWGVRAVAAEPHAIALRRAQVTQTPPTARHHPWLWRLLRDHARRALTADPANP